MFDKLKQWLRGDPAPSAAGRPTGFVMLDNPAQLMDLVWDQVGSSPAVVAQWQQAEALARGGDWAGALAAYDALRALDDPWRAGSALSAELWAMAGVRKSVMLVELGRAREASDVQDEVGTAMQQHERPMTPLNLLAYYFARGRACIALEDEVGLIFPMREALDVAVNLLHDHGQVVAIWEMFLGGLAAMRDWGVLRLRCGQAAKYLALLADPHRSQLAARIAHYQALAAANAAE